MFACRCAGVAGFEVLKNSHHELGVVADFQVYAGTNQWILKILGEMQSLVPYNLLIMSQSAVTCQNMLPFNMMPRFRGNILKRVTNAQEVGNLPLHSLIN